MENEIKLLTIRETAKTGILSETCLRLMEKQGRLPGIYVGRKFLVNYPMLLDVLQEASRQKAIIADKRDGKQSA